MYVELMCGKCDSALHMDAEDDETSALWLLVHRFANAHSACGYMTPPPQIEEAKFDKKDVDRPVKKYVGRRRPEASSE